MWLTISTNPCWYFTGTAKLWTGSYQVASTRILSMLNTGLIALVTLALPGTYVCFNNTVSVWDLSWWLYNSNAGFQWPWRKIQPRLACIHGQIIMVSSQWTWLAFKGPLLNPSFLNRTYWFLDINSPGPLLLNVIPAWISNHMPSQATGLDA